MNESKQVRDLLKFQLIVSVSPYPQGMREDFDVTGKCVSGDYIINPDPTVIGQYLIRGKVAMTILVHIVPK